ncbi:PQQ-binding-like beta-propeller repeat protein [Limnoglobus roseus]|uniref:Serine protease n=1 Tax=Limnoglobus roseus TaxID=2598579 RepID=A0A5C1AES8_9BACT|nr:hypothetical protein [Limnoglobus roseus]QEL15614.1 serine protease [Limnoglobus roseus]
MKRFFVLLALLVIPVTTVSAADAIPVKGNMLRMPYPGGLWASLPDGVTLVVSYPDKGQLVYYDTLAEKEAKRVDLDFQPAYMAVQGDTLFVAGRGSSAVHVLDAKTGKEKKEIILGGDAIANLACHPTKGLLYASTQTLQVFAVDPAAGTATKTGATGNFLVVDPVDAKALFTGVQPPINQDTIYIKDLPDGRIKIYFDDWGVRAFVLKYAVDGKELKLVSSQKNAAVNAWSLAVTPDGKKVLMPSGGGWRPPVEGGTGGGYICAAFSTEKLEARLGEIPTAANITFHPVLNMGVLNHQGRDLQFFNPKSLIVGKTWHVADGADSRALVAFGGKGTKIVFWNGDNPTNPQEGLHFLPLDLTADDRAALTKVYGKLPDPVVIVSPAKPAGPEKTMPEKSATGGLTTTVPAVKPVAAKPEVVPAAKPAVEVATLPKGVIAIAGFNNKKGLNSGKAVDLPYPLGKNGVRGGYGEPGWVDVWPGETLIKYVTDVVGEGDGAVNITGTTNYGRKWTERQTGQFRVEVMARSPKGGDVLCYVMEDSDLTTGPFWGVKNGKFEALDGNGSGQGNWKEFSPCKPDTWYTVKVAVDIEKQTWTAAVDNGKPAGPFKFRYKPTALQRINFLTHGDAKGIYLDAIRILAADGK